MKKNKYLLLLLVGLIFAATYLYFKNTSDTYSEIKGSKSDFAIEDTAAISKIFIADAKGKQVTLSKQNDVWMVNEKYVARPDNIRLLMKTFGRIAVQSPVPKAALNNTIRAIATGGIKVEVYLANADLPEKTYYVGGPTLNHQGTYMLLETEGVKSSVPYITHIPGFMGYLTTRFFTEAEQWRDAVVFKNLPNEIKRIVVNHHENPQESFVIEQDKERFLMKDFTTNAVITDVDTFKVNKYISLFDGIYYEMIDVESSTEKKDSIKGSSPFFTIEVEDYMGQRNAITAFHMPNYRQTIDKSINEPFEYDVDRLYADLNDELFVLIQFATFDQITLTKSFFKN